MEWEEIDRIIRERIIELTRAKRIVITKNFSEHLAFKEVVSQELITEFQNKINENVESLL